MASLLAQFTITEIILCVVLIVLAGKGIVDFIHWARDRMKERVHVLERPDELEKHLEEELLQIEKTHCEHIDSLKAKDEKLQDNIDKLAENVKILSDDVGMLIESDKAAILAWITQQHHYFLRLGWVDEFSLLTIEKRFKHYQEEGGNSFAEDLMKDIRNLPKQPPQES